MLRPGMVNDRHPPSPRRRRFLLPLALLLLSLPAHAQSSGVDPSMALWGSSAIALLFTIAGGLALAQYHRTVGAVDGSLKELRSESQALRELVARTREQYATRDEMERINTIETTLRQEMRTELGALRSDSRAELADVRDQLKAVEVHLHEVTLQVTRVEGDIKKILAIVTNENLR